MRCAGLYESSKSAGRRRLPLLAIRRTRGNALVDGPIVPLHRHSILNLGRDRAQIHVLVTEPALQLATISESSRTIFNYGGLLVPVVELPTIQVGRASMDEVIRLSRSDFDQGRRVRLSLLHKAEPKVGVGGRALEHLLLAGVEAQFKAADLATDCLNTIQKGTDTSATPSATRPSTSSSTNVTNQQRLQVCSASPT